MVFNQYGNQYFLSEIWAAEAIAGYRLHPSKLEREVAKSFGKPKRETLAAKKIWIALKAAHRDDPEQTLGLKVSFLAARMSPPVFVAN